jgi:hypothetical protein
MRDRRRVGLVDHSDQRDREKISRVKEGFLICIYLSLQQAHIQKDSKTILWQGQKGSVGTISCIMK